MDADEFFNLLFSHFILNCSHTEALVESLKIQRKYICFDCIELVRANAQMQLIARSREHKHSRANTSRAIHTPTKDLSIYTIVQECTSQALFLCCVLNWIEARAILCILSKQQNANNDRAICNIYVLLLHSMARRMIVGRVLSNGRAYWISELSKHIIFDFTLQLKLFYPANAKIEVKILRRSSTCAI